MCLLSDCPIQVFEISLTFPYPKLVMVSPTYPFCSPPSLHCNPLPSSSYLLELQSISFLPQLQQSSRKTSKLSHIPVRPLTSNTKYIRIKISFMSCFPQKAHPYSHLEMVMRNSKTDVFHRSPAHDKNGQCIGKKCL